MSVSGRRLNLGVAQQFADHGKSLASSHCGGGKGVAQVMDTHVLQSGPRSHTLPEWLEVAEPLSFQCASDDPWVVRDPFGGFEQINRWLAEMDHFGTRLGIGQAEDFLGQVNVLPLQGHDLIQAAACEDQQSCRQDRGGQFNAFAFHLPQHLANATKLCRAEETFPFFFGVFPNVLARVRAVRTEPPHFSEAEHLGNNLQAAIGLVGDVPQVVMELGDVGPGDVGDRQPTEGRENEALQVAAVLLGRACLHPDRDVLLVEAVRQLLDRDDLPSSVTFGGRVLPVLCSGNDGDGAGSGLLAGEDGAGAKAHPARSSSGAKLDDIALAAAGKNSKPEAGDVVIPDEIFGRPDLGGVDNAFGKFRHGRPAFKSITLLTEIASGRPWKHCGSKRANTVARAFEKQCAGRPA